MGLITYNGKLLTVGAAGLATDTACCCQTYNPCDPDPEILLTVSGASGAINWCGETWNLPGDSGVQKSVCPFRYTASRTASGTSYAYATNIWTYGPTVALNPYAAEFLLFRQYTKSIYSGSFTNVSSFRAQHRIKISPNSSGVTDRFQWFASATLATMTITTFSTGIGVLSSGNAYATYSNYKINDDFFGSYTSGGITYAWAKGHGW